MLMYVQNPLFFEGKAPPRNRAGGCIFDPLMKWLILS